MNLATAFVEIRADGEKGKADARRAIKEMTAGVDATVELQVDDTKARQTVDKVAKDIDGVSAEIGVDVDDKTVVPVRTIDQRLSKLDGEDRTVLLRAEVKAAESEVTRLERKLQDPSLDDQEIRLVIDERNEAAKKIDSIKKDLGELPEVAEKSADSVTKKIAQLFGAAAFAKGIKETIDAASNLQQAVGATETVFGEAKTAIDTFADSAAEGFGISERAARELTAATGALLQNFGLTAEEAATTSVSLAKLGADLAAAFGGNPEEAVEALGAALRGENDPVERFGISLSAVRVEAKALELGLITAGQEMDSNAKIQATLALITEQTANVQGQAAREADTAAGAQARATAKAEDAAASLGSNFLPVYSRVVQVVGAVASAFGDLPAPVQTAIVGLVALAALSGPIKSLTEVAKSFTKVVESVGAKAAGLAGGVGNLGVALSGVGLIVTAATLYYADYEAQKAKVAAITKTFVDALGQEEDGQRGALTATIANTVATSEALRLGRELGLTAEDLARVILGQSVPAYDALNKKLEDGHAQNNQTGVDLYLLTDQMDELSGALATAKQQVSDKAEADKIATAVTATLGEETARAGDAAAAAAGPIDAMSLATHGAGEAARLGADAQDEWEAGTKAAEEAAKLHSAAVDDLVDSVDAQVTSFDALSSAAAGLRTALDKVFGASVSMEEADRAARAAKDDLSEAVKSNGVTLDSNTEKGRANRAQIQQSVSSILDYGAAVVGAGGSTDQAAASVQFMTDQLKAQLIAAGFTKDEVDSYITTLGLTPDNVTTAIQVAGDEQAKTILKDRQDDLDKLSDGAIAEIQALVDQGKYQDALTLLNDLTADRTTNVYVKEHGSTKGYASGTRSATPGLHPVAERGRELVDYGGGQLALFSGGETVYNHSDTERILAGQNPAGSAGNVVNQTAVVHNNGRAVTVDDVSRALAIARMQ